MNFFYGKHLHANLLVYCNVLQALFQNEAKCLLKYHVNISRKTSFTYIKSALWSVELSIFKKKTTWKSWEPFLKQIKFLKSTFILFYMIYYYFYNVLQQVLNGMNFKWSTWDINYFFISFLFHIHETLISWREIWVKIGLD